MSDSPQSQNDFNVQPAEMAEQRSRRSRRIRWAIIISIAAHAIILLIALYWYLPQRNAALAKSATRQPANTPVPPPPEPKPLPPAPAADVSAGEIQKSIESQLNEVEKLADQHKLTQLEKNLRRLEAIASPESVNEVTTKITSSLGLDPNQYAPKDPQEIPKGRFDMNTAQLADVSRLRSDNGNWQYVSTLVDAQGRELSVPVAASEGETMFKTFQQMKKFPMAAGLYRSVVMPMMQKLIEAQDVAKQAAGEAESMNAEKLNAEPTQNE